MNAKILVKKVVYQFTNRKSTGGGKFKSKISPSALLKKCRIKINGTDNTLLIGNNVFLTDTVVFINGNHNRIAIGDNCTLKGVSLWIEGDDNCINIGERTTIEKHTHIAAVEGKNVNIGIDCMISSDVHIVTTDSHSIIQADGKRLNPGKDVNIGNHVWIGYRCIVLKGTTIPNNCVLGAASCITTSFNEEGCIIAGVPGKEIKTNMNWCRERI